MTIYSTPFTNSNKQTTGPSTAQPFPDLAAVATAMGPPVHRTFRTLVYGDGENRVIFSDFILSVDASPGAGV